MSVKRTAVQGIARAAGAVLRTADRYISGSYTGASEKELRDNPYASLATMRSRGAVLRSYAMRGWWIGGFEEAQAAFRDTRFGSDLRKNPFVVRALRAVADGEPVPTIDDPSILTLDPPDHTRLRKLAARGFIQRHIAALEPQIQRLVDDALNAIEEQFISIAEKFSDESYTEKVA
jgi:cytochrome P450